MPNSVPLPTRVPNVISSSNENRTDSIEEPSTDFRVNSRVQSESEVETPALSSSEPNTDQGNSSPFISNSPILDESAESIGTLEILDEPIALRKGTRNCTTRQAEKFPMYPLSNYVSYKNVSPAFRAFTTNLLIDERTTS